MVTGVVRLATRCQNVTFGRLDMAKVKVLTGGLNPQILVGFSNYRPSIGSQSTKPNVNLNQNLLNGTLNTNMPGATMVIIVLAVSMYETMLFFLGIPNFQFPLQTSES